MRINKGLMIGLVTFMALVAVFVRWLPANAGQGDLFPARVGTIESGKQGLVLSSVPAKVAYIAFNTVNPPLPARYFCETTFAYIRDDKPHEVAAALAVARERIIPGMFRRFLDGMGVTEGEAPSMHFYLNRHVHLDADVRGRLSMQLIHELCADDPTRIEEAETAAEEALCARIRFWDGIHAAITARQHG